MTKIYNSLNITIPYDFFVNSAITNWYDIRLAINSKYLSANAAIEYAVDKLQEEDCTHDVLDLSLLSFENEVYMHSLVPYIDRLADSVEDCNKKYSKDKLLYILLKWIFENQVFFKDSLKAIDYVYEDFDRPTSMNSFVYWLPRQDSFSSSKYDWRSNLYYNWECFLNQQKRKWS